MSRWMDADLGRRQAARTIATAVSVPLRHQQHYGRWWQQTTATAAAVVQRRLVWCIHHSSILLHRIDGCDVRLEVVIHSGCRFAAAAATDCIGSHVQGAQPLLCRRQVSRTPVSSLNLQQHQKNKLIIHIQPSFLHFPINMKAKKVFKVFNQLLLYSNPLPPR